MGGLGVSPLVMAAYTRQITSQPTMWVSQSFSTIINTVVAQGGKQTMQLNASYRSRIHWADAKTPHKQPQRGKGLLHPIYSPSGDKFTICFQITYFMPDRA